MVRLWQKQLNPLLQCSLPPGGRLSPARGPPHKGHQIQQLLQTAPEQSLFSRCDVRVEQQPPILRSGTIGNQLAQDEHTSELQSRGHLVCRLLLVKKKSAYL